MKGHAVKYSDAELAWLKERAATPRRELYTQFQAEFGREDVSFNNLKALCKRKRWFTGRTGRYSKGHIPANKGVKGFYSPGSEKGWFKKGVRSGVAVKLHKPIGYERVRGDGYLVRKVNDDMPARKRWREVHVINWVAQNGPVPEGHCLKCIDGNRLNVDASNWLALPRALIPRLNGRWGNLKYDDAEPELKPYVLEAARLDQAAREAKKSAARKNKK